MGSLKRVFIVLALGVFFRDLDLGALGALGDVMRAASIAASIAMSSACTAK